MKSRPPNGPDMPPGEQRRPWPPIEALESSGPPPDRRPPLRPTQIILAVAVALGVGALLGSGALVGLAERQPVGTGRDVALGTAEAADRVAHLLSLNRPAERLAAALNGESEVYDVETLLATARMAANSENVNSGGTEPPPPESTGDDPAAGDGTTMTADGPPAGDGTTMTADRPPAGDGGTGPPVDGLDDPVASGDCVPTAGSAGTGNTGAAETGDCPHGYEPAAPADPPGRSTTGSERPSGTTGTETTLPGSARTDDAQADDAQAAPEESATLPDDAQAGEDGSTAPDSGAPSTPEGPVLEGPRTAGEGEPLHVYVGGDSISRDLGEGLARVSPGDLVRIDLDQRPATGLSRPDFFDWEQHIAGVLIRISPDVIVVMFGANDFQNVEHEGRVLDRFESDWRELYEQRVARMMTLLSQPGTQTIWVGQPPVRDSRLTGGLAMLNEVYAAQAAQHPQVTFVDTWELFSGPGGGYTAEIGGERVRREDGVHLTIAGGNRLAEAVWEMIAPAWGLD